MRILGIESSCDETAAAVLEERRGRFFLKSGVIASQVAIHAQTKGVVPEVAARNHVKAILPVIAGALGKQRFDAIAVTSGPGLVTSLSVGVHTARTLSYLWRTPLVAVNHIEGHLYSSWLQAIETPSADIVFPALVLIVSGGHTELILMKDHGAYKKIGQTLDDAAGEVFDKVARMLDLGYPGGPAISREAQSGDRARFDFPRALLFDPTRRYDFSFSGLKTSVLYRIRDLKEQKQFSKKLIPHLCASFEQAVVDVLVGKTLRAARALQVKSILLGGGVVANRLLRSQMADMAVRELPDVSLHIPIVKYCTDNAAMIAMAGYFHARKKEYTPWKKIDARAEWSL
ncbi:MAG: tRNA (adenosine(37)-N6)-threonylcarbamoyltransferase complex transferase subunit TsaD [Patescibacteria group bacterium]